MKKPPNQRPFVVTFSDVIGKDEYKQLRQVFPISVECVWVREQRRRMNESIDLYFESSSSFTFDVRMHKLGPFK